MCLSLLEHLAHVDLLFADLVQWKRACQNELFHDVFKHVSGSLDHKVNLAIRCTEVRGAVDHTSQAARNCRVESKVGVYGERTHAVAVEEARQVWSHLFEQSVDLMVKLFNCQPVDTRASCETIPLEID